MKLSTVECSVLGCGQEFTHDLPMFHVEHMAQDAGWVVDGDKALCPEHVAALGGPLAPEWVVGCYTCGWEESLDEDDARYEYKEHQCEPETYLTSPDDLAKKERSVKEYQERRASERAEEEHQAAMTAATAVAHQKRLEMYASRWLKIRNTVVFWKKEHIHEGHSSTEGRQPAREDRSGHRER